MACVNEIGHWLLAGRMAQLLLDFLPLLDGAAQLSTSACSMNIHVH